MGGGVTGPDRLESDRLAVGVRDALRAYIDRLAASDPGLNRLVTSARVVVGVGVTIAVEYGFMHATHAMWTAAPAQQRSITLLAMLLGGIVAMMSALAVTDPTPRGQAVTLGLMPIPMLATMALSITLSSHHTLGLVVLALVVGAGTYMRKLAPRFGPRVVLYGALLFMGYFFGFLAGAEIPLHDLGWVAAILWLAVVVNLALRLLADVTVDRRAVARAAHGFDVRARRVAGAAARLLRAGTPRARQRMARQLARRLARMNEAALMIDGQLINASLTSTPLGAWTLHRRVFDAELALQTIGRLTQQLAPSLAPELRIELSKILSALRLGRDDEAESLARGLTDSSAWLPVVTDAVSAARVQALAAAIIDTGEALRAGPGGDGPDQIQAAAETPFTSPVKFTGGNLSGSSQTSAAAVDPGQRERRLPWLTLDAPARTAIRVTIAVGAACAFGSWLSEQRFYWAVIAVFIAFMGANTAGEQIIKAANRVLGTVVGILLGSLIATAVGPGTWALAVILPALALGVYFQRVSYSLMVTGITIMVAQLYVLLGEYSSGLLMLRLEETAIGAAIAMLASIVILPVRTRRATRFAIGGCLDALADLLDHLAADSDHGEGWGGHSGDQRAIDDALQQLLVTARPLAHDPFRSRQDLERTLGLIETAGYYTRTAVAITLDGIEAGLQFGDLRDVLHRQRDSVQHLSAAVRGDSEADGYEPITSQLEAIEVRLAAQAVAPEDPRRRCIRILARLDETLLALAGELRTGQPKAVRRFEPSLSTLEPIGES
jgi:hypothetical protein